MNTPRQNYDVTDCPHDDVTYSYEYKPNMTSDCLEKRSNMSSQAMPANFNSCQRNQFQFILHEVAIPLLFSLITFIGVIGNSLVIFVILTKERMRTVTNLLLMNLAVTDLLFVLVVPPVTAYVFATANWPFGYMPCKLMHYIVNVSAYITVYTLVLVTIIRYMTIVHNASTVTLRTRRNIMFLIATIWVVMLIVNIPIFSSYTLVPNGCGYPDCQHKDIDVARQVFATLFVFAYLLPLGIIGVFSVCILHHITKHRSQILSTRSRSANKKKRAGMVLILVVVVFAILWLPIHIHLLTAVFSGVPDDAWYQVVSILWNCLAYANSCVNPIIYNHASKDFRDAFRDVICCGRSPAVAAGGAGCTGEEKTEGFTGTAGLTTNTTTTQMLSPVGAGQPIAIVESVPLCKLSNSPERDNVACK